jgi:hypothetical protein
MRKLQTESKIRFALMAGLATCAGMLASHDAAAAYSGSITRSVCMAGAMVPRNPDRNFWDNTFNTTCFAKVIDTGSTTAFHWARVSIPVERKTTTTTITPTVRVDGGASGNGQVCAQFWISDALGNLSTGAADADGHRRAEQRTGARGGAELDRGRDLAMALARVALGVAVAAGLAIGIWPQRWSSKSDGQLEARIAALEAAGSRQAERVIQREIRVEVAPGTPASTAEAQPGEAEAAVTAGRAFRSNVELAAAYAASFASEPVDAAWATEAERRYLPAIREALPSSSRLVSFECRSQFCDVAVVHDSIDTSNAFILDLFAMDRHGPLSQGTAGFRAGEPQRTDDGKLLYHLYVGRPGALLAIDQPQNQPVRHAEKSF